MVLRDYLELKVEIEGTSGEGSLAVKSLRELVPARGPRERRTLLCGSEFV
jgi:hypothetical protein